MISFYKRYYDNPQYEAIKNSELYKEKREKRYELEEKLTGYDFIRINKSMILNIRHVEYIMPDIQSRFVVVLKNKEKLIVTRNYASEFKIKWKERRI